MTRRRRGISAIGAVAALLALLVVAPAVAKDKLDSFAGSCSFQGTVEFTPPATNTQQPLFFTYRANGTCSGTVDGRSVSNAPVKLFHSGHSDGSCLHANTTSPGQGEFTFAGGPTIPYTFEFQFIGTEGSFNFQGQRSGSATGTGSFLTQRTSPTSALQCGGAGIKTAPMDMSLMTQSPLVSKASGHHGDDD
jgi:hypothetical protein